MQCQATIDGKRLECLLVYLRENAVPIPLVDHLYHTNDVSTDENGHAENGLGVVTGQGVNFTVEAFIFISVRNIQTFPGQCHMASDAFAKRESEQNQHFCMKIDSQPT